MLSITYKDRSTKQMVYVSENSDGLYLSEKALADLGMIDSKFPGVDTSSKADAVSSSKKEEEGDDCKCIPRKEAPEAPKKIPYPPTEENKAKLKTWLTNEFESSAFNTCTHQPLQEMTGGPMKFHFKDSYEPYAVHTPLPIPHHWEEKVKKANDCDVK